MWFMPNSELTSKSHSRNQDLFDHIFPIFWCTFWWYDMSYSLSLLFLADSAVVFSCCCAYLIYCCLPLNLKHSGLCALTCGNNNEFSSNDISHSRYFQLFGSFYINPWAYVEKSQKINSFWNYQTSRQSFGPWHKQPSSKSPPFPSLF